MPVRAFIGADEVTDYLVGIDAPRIGPGVVGSGTLYIDKAAGGLDLRMGEEVKVYRTFNDAGAGVADRGRYFFGIIADRETTNAVNIKQWAIPCHSYNVLTTKIVRDAADAKSITLSADNFDAQIANLIQQIQENGHGAVAKTISTTGVADLHATMPSVTLPPGHSLGWYLAYLGNTVRTLNPAVYPAFFIDTERTFGVGEAAGGATLHFYDASLMPSPLYTYANDPVGAERSWYAPPKRILTGSSVVNRRQLVFREGEVIATYAETASGATYPNDWINHGLTGNTGYWMAEPIDDSEIEHWQDAEAAIRGEVQKTAYPRETVELAVAEQIYVGDVVTIINDLEGISQDMRVVESKVDWSWDAVDPGSIIRCGARLLRLGEDSEGIPVPPTEGDVTPPPVPTWDNTPVDDWINQNEQEPGADGVTLELETTLVEPGDMSHYIWRYIYQAAPIPVNARWNYARTEAADKTLTLTEQPFNTVMTVQVEAFDTAGNGSGWSATASLTTAMRRFYDYPPNMHFEPGRESGDDDSESPFQSTYPWGWEPTENGLSTARLYAADRMDGLTCLRLFHDGSNTPAVMSGLFPIVDDTPQTYNWAGYVKGQTAGDDIVFRVYWYDENGVTVGDVAAGTADLTTSWAPFSWFVDSPGFGAKWASLHIGGGSLGTFKWGQVDAMNFMQQVKGDQLSPELVYEGEFTIDPVSGGNLRFLDGEGNLVATMAGAGTVGAANRLFGAELTGTADISFVSTRDIVLDATDDISILADDTMTIDAANGITFPGTINVVGAATLATLSVNDKLNLSYDALSANTTLDSHIAVTVDATGANRVITLPDAAGNTGRVYLVKKIDSSANVVTVDGDGADTIDGATTFVLRRQYESVGVQSDGTNWHILAYHPGQPNVNSGPSFPTSVSGWAGRAFYQTTIGRWGYSDGTNWLGEVVTFPLHNYLGTPPYTGTTEALAGGVPGDYAFKVERFDVGWYTGVDQDVSNFWTIRLRRLTSGSSVDTIKDLSTHPDSAGNWNKVSGTSGFTNNPMNASDIWLQVYITPTGSPGNLNLQANVTGRFVLA